MAQIQRKRGSFLRPKAEKAAKAGRKSRVPLPEVTLPKEMSEPLTALADYSYLVFGEKKIGKTTMLSHAPDTIFLMFEPGGKGLRLYQRPIKSWREFLAYLDLLEKDKKFRTVIVDTVDRAYDLCFEYMCEKLVITHPQDENDFGKAWGEIKKEFASAIDRLLKLDKGVFFTSHAQEKEVRPRKGEKFERLMPTMASQAYKYLVGIIDVVAYYGFDGKERVLTIRGDDYVGAGCRLEENFVTPGGEFVEQIPMGGSSKEAWENFNNAFKNLQKATTADGQATTASKPTKKKKLKIGKK